MPLSRRLGYSNNQMVSGILKLNVNKPNKHVEIVETFNSSNYSFYHIYMGVGSGGQEIIFLPTPLNMYAVLNKVFYSLKSCKGLSIKDVCSQGGLSSADNGEGSSDADVRTFLHKKLNFSKFMGGGV